MLLLKDGGIVTTNSYTDPDLEWEIVETQPGVTYDLKGGGKIEIPEIQFPDNSGIHTYIITRKIKPLKAGDEVISYDFVFGDVNFYLLYNDAKYRERFSKYIISRRGIDEILQNVCGTLPKDVSFTHEEQVAGKFPGIERYIFDKKMMDNIITSVLTSSHRSIVDIDNENKSKGEDFPKDFRERMRILEGTEEEKKPKKSFREVFKEYDREVKKAVEKEKKDKMGYEEHLKKAEEPAFNVNDSLVLFYPTGGMLITVPTYSPYGIRSSFDRCLINRYNILYKKSNSNFPLRTRSILITGVDEKRLSEKGEYRDDFIKDICIPVIQYDNGKTSFFEQEYKYIGKFNETKECSIMELTTEEKWINKYLEELSKREKEKVK